MKAWLRRGWPWLVVTFGFAVVAWVAVVDPSAAIKNFSPAAPVDLLAFYCSARVAASGSDPYLAEPLRSCEHEEFRRSTGHVSRYPLLVIPAPLPPYALFLLKPLAALTPLGFPGNASLSPIPPLLAATTFVRDLLFDTSGWQLYDLSFWTLGVEMRWYIVCPLLIALYLRCLLYTSRCV